MIVFSIYFNFLYSCQVGIRHFLVVYPFLIVLCGSILEERETARKAPALTSVAIVVYLLVSNLS